MAAHQRGCVERLRVEWTQRMLPQGREQQGRDHTVDRVLDVDRAELAAGDPAAEQRGEQPPAPADDLIEIEPRQLREVARLGDHQLGQRREPRAVHLLDEHARDIHQEPRHRPRSLGRGFELLQGRHEVAAHHRLEQLFLVLEVEVSGSLGHSCPGRHVLQPRGGEAPLGEAIQRGLQDLPGAGILATAPADRRFRLHRDLPSNLAN